MLRAFFTGGAVCCAGQALLMLFLRLGLSEENAFNAVSASLVFLGALLTAVGVYDRMAKFCGAGTLVPITGFANSVAAPAIEFRAEGFVTGTAVKMFTIAGPVIVFGTAASAVYGLVLVLLGYGG
jgi:stage V sporulation protein AC